jgi:GT2 family glycosyltransferase
MSDPLVTVGLVTWNSAPHLPACLEALADQRYRRLELVVVDNASSDDSLSLVAARWPAAAVKRNSVNEGFSAAHNRAIRQSSGVYYLALNPDVVLDPYYLARLVESLERGPQHGSAGGKLWQTPSPGGPKRIDTAGLYLGRNRRQLLRGRDEIDRGQYDQPAEVFGVDGAAPLYRRAMLDDVAERGEIFDPAFFAYKEDVDLAWRARHLGWSAWYEPAAQAYHARAFKPGTRGPGDRDRRRYSVRNRYLLLIKNETMVGLKRDWLPILAYDVGIIGYLLLREPSSLRAFWDLVRLWPGMLKKRRALMQRSRVAPAELLTWFR